LEVGVSERGAGVQQWIGRICVGLTMFVVGVAAGIWISHKSGVNLPDLFAPTQAPQVTGDSAETLLGAPAEPRSAQEEHLAADPAPSGALGEASGQAKAATADGDSRYQFRFSPGERILYKCNTNIRGHGLEALGASEVVMAFGADISLLTERVAKDGSADLVLHWDAVSLEGDFMGSEVYLYQNAQEAIFEMDGRDMLANAEGDDPTQGIPQMEFFQNPVNMTIAPSGEVTGLSGSEGIGDVLALTPALSRLEFPGIRLEEGFQWKSDFKLPVPGFGTAADARIENTVTGFQYVGDRFCAVIHQKYVSRQENGTLDSPQSALGEAMQFGMPLFDLQGEGLTYFDVNNGQLAHTELNMKLTLQIAEFLGSLSGPSGDWAGQLGALLGGQLSAVDELLGGSAAPEETDNVLDLSLDIEAGMSIVDVP
jgi:hypothetical protein